VNAEKFAQVKRDSAEALAKIPVMSKGVGRSAGPGTKIMLLGGSISAANEFARWYGLAASRLKADSGSVRFSGLRIAARKFISAGQREQSIHVIRTQRLRPFGD
jgi:hypothetical protein